MFKGYEPDNDIKKYNINFYNEQYKEIKNCLSDNREETLKKMKIIHI